MATEIILNKYWQETEKLKVEAQKCWNNKEPIKGNIIWMQAHSFYREAVTDYFGKKKGRDRIEWKTGQVFFPQQRTVIPIGEFYGEDYS